MLLFFFFNMFIDQLDFHEEFQFKLGEWELQIPSAITVDSKNNFLVVDHKGNCVYVFDANGNPVHRFGETGNGPGEFSFRGVVRINIVDKNICITDDNTRKAYYFDDSYRFLKILKINFSIKDLHSFGDNFIAHLTSAKDQEQSISFLSSTLEKNDVVLKMKDLTWTKDTEKKWVRKYNANRYIVNKLGNYFVVSESKKSYVSFNKVIQNSLKETRRVKVPLIAHTVNAKERKEMEIHANKAGIRFVIDDKNWIISDLLAYKEEFIVAVQDESKDIYSMKGVCLNPKGESIGKLTLSFDEGVYYEGTKHGIVAFDSTDENIIPKLYSIHKNGVDIAK